MHGCLDNGSLATSSYLRNANIKTYVEKCIETKTKNTCNRRTGTDLRLREMLRVTRRINSGLLVRVTSTGAGALLRNC